MLYVYCVMVPNKIFWARGTVEPQSRNTPCTVWLRATALKRKLIFFLYFENV